VDAASNILEDFKSPCTGEIHAGVNQAGSETLRSEIHKYINYICNKEELPQLWKESITVLIYKKGDKFKFNNYPGLSLLPFS
jgi:hypothetical protein